MTVHRGIGPAITPATVVVAASDSLHPERADYKCNGTDDDVQIQEAIDALPACQSSLSSYAGEAALLEGTYNTSSTVNFNKYCSTLRFCDGARIEYSGAASALKLYQGTRDHTYSTVTHPWIRATSTGAVGIEIDGSSTVTIVRPMLYQCDSHGIHLKNCNTIQIIGGGAIVGGNDAGVYLDTSPGTKVNQVLVELHRIGYKDYGVQIGDSAYSQKCEQVTARNTYLDNLTYGILGYVGHSVVLMQNYFESINTNCVYVENTGTYVPNQWYLLNNFYTVAVTEVKTTNYHNGIYLFLDATSTSWGANTTHGEVQTA